MRRVRLLPLLLLSAEACVDNSGAGPGVDAGFSSTDLPANGALAFDDTDCGSIPAAKTFAFHNTGGGTITWNATITGVGFSIRDGAAGSAAPGATATITIAPDVIPTSATAGTAITASMIVTTNVGGASPVIALSVIPHGGSLKIASPTVGFGQVQLMSVVDRPLTLTNAGDRAIQVSFVAPSVTDFTASNGATQAVDVGPGAALAGAVAHFKPTRAGAESSAIGVQVTGATCGGDVPSIALSGEGTTATTTITPGILPFGAIACGDSAAPQTVTIQNAYATPIHYTAAIATGPYAIAAGQLTGTVPANGSATIAVTATAVPKAAASLVDGALAGTMTVTTDAPNATPATLKMAQTATGAVLSLTPAGGQTIAFGDVLVGAPSSKPYSVTNTGNIDAAVTAAATGPGFSASAPAGGTVAKSGGTAAGTITQTVAQAGNVTGSFTLSSTTALCQDAAPAAIALTSTGHVPTALIGAAPAMTSTCGGSPTTVTVPISNTGDAPLVIGSASATGGFVVTTALPLTIAAGASSAISVRAPAAVIGTDLGGGTKNGTLTIGTNEVAGATHAVSLASTIVGANLSFLNVNGTPITTATFTAAESCPPYQTIYVANGGNASATVSITTPDMQGFEWFGFSPSSTVAGGAAISHTLGVWSLNNDACTGAEGIQYAATGSVCTALPLVLQASFTITGQSQCFCS